MNVKPVDGIDSVEFEIGGQADEALVERALVTANEHFRGADINSAFVFATSYLASMIVMYERHVLGAAGQFDYDSFSETLRDAVMEGHGLRPRKPS